MACKGILSSCITLITFFYDSISSLEAVESLKLAFALCSEVGLFVLPIMVACQSTAISSLGIEIDNGNLEIRLPKPYVAQMQLTLCHLATRQWAKK